MPRERIPIEDHKLRSTLPQYVEREPDGIIRPGRPKMPPTLNPVAAERWKEMIRILRSRRTLTRADGPLLENYCVIYARWVAFCKKLDEEGPRDADGKLNPLAKAISALESRMQSQLQQLGCTPVSREKARQLPKPTAPIDPMEATFGRDIPAPAPEAPTSKFDDFEMPEIK